MTRNLLILCLTCFSFWSYGQDTLYISGKMFLGTYEKVDSAAQIIEFSEFQSDRRFIVPFASVTRESKKTESTTESYFVNLGSIDSPPVKNSLFRDPAKFRYGPLTLGVDLLSTILVSEYRMPGNSSIGGFLSYQWSEKYAAEVNYRRGIGIPQQETIVGWSDRANTDYLRESFGASFLIFPTGQSKFAPMVGLMYRFGSGVYYHELARESFGINPESGIRDVYQNYTVDYERRSVDFSDLGFVLGYRLNLTKSLNMEARVPLYSTNSQSKMNSGQSFSNFDSEEYRLQWSYGNEDYREWQLQFKIFFIYRFQGVAKP